MKKLSFFIAGVFVLAGCGDANFVNKNKKESPKEAAVVYCEETQHLQSQNGVIDQQQLANQNLYPPGCIPAVQGSPVVVVDPGSGHVQHQYWSGQGNVPGAPPGGYPDYVPPPGVPTDPIGTVPGGQQPYYY